MKEIFGDPAGLDERSLDFLAKTLEQNNLPGFDFLEFKKSAAGLLKLGMDEATAIKSVFTTAATMGLTKEKLVETAAYYRNLLEKERDAFDNAHAVQMQEKVDSKKTGTIRLRDQIERNKSEITRLQDEIGGWLNSITDSEKLAALESEKLEKSKKSFEFAHAEVLLRLDQDVEKIHQNL